MPPSHGDVVVGPDKMLIISMAPDEVENATDYLFYVCGDRPDIPDTVRGVVARQLGYRKCVVSYPDMGNKA